MRAMILSLFLPAIVIGVVTSQYNTQQPGLISGNPALGDSDEASSFLRQYDSQAVAACHALVSAQWDYATNVTDKGADRVALEQAQYDKFLRAAWRRAESTVPWRSLAVSQPRVYRQFLRLFSRARDSTGVPEERVAELQDLFRELRDIHSRTLVCPAPGTEQALAPLTAAAAAATRSTHRCTLRLEPELTSLMRNSRDPYLLAFAWRGWRDAVGPHSKQRFVRLVQIVNIAAKRNGFRDLGEQWRAEFEQDLSPGGGPGLEESAAIAWRRLEPLYRQLHTFVRRRLAQYYGSAIIRPKAPIPAHLLGNMWAQSWGGIEDLVLPFPEKPLPDVSAELSRQGYTPMGLLQVAEQWFTSLGLPAMSSEFWRRSLLQRPNDRPVLCGASAWDFCDGQDYRMKMCAAPTYADFLAAHHELAHVQYYMHYASQPTLFRDGANPAFHEAVGEMVGLSITSPEHLQRLGLFPGNNSNDEEIQMNFLMRQALEKVAFIPFSYLVDLWRWKVFSGEWQPNELNERWWQLRVTLQGVSPPVRRSPSDFDPGAKRHIATNRPYIGYMVSTLLQYQLLQSLCRVAGHRGPLHRCDLQNRREAGRLLSQVMSLGSSKPWPEVLAIINGGSSSPLMDTAAILDYFQPLEQWLRVQNGREGLDGWDVSGLDSEYFSPLSTAGSASATSATLSFTLAIVVRFLINRIVN